MIALVATYNSFVILLSFGIAFIGSYMTICLCEHYRLCSFTDTRSKILSKSGLMFLMACSLGGVGIWGMHFVGMASVSLKTEDGLDVPMHFQIMPTIMSLIFVLLFAFFGLFVSSYDVVFCKNKIEIVDLFVKNSSELSTKDIKAISMWRMMFIISTQSLQHLVCGGFLAGCGVVCMHYLGMWAMSLDGIIVWNEGIITASILIALVAATAAFWILFRLLSLYPHLEILRLGSAIVMAHAVCGMHYTGMFAARFEYDPSHATKMNTDLAVWGEMSKSVAFISALVMSVLFIFVVAMFTLADLRAWRSETSDQLDKAERLLAKIEENSYNTAICNYFDKKKAKKNEEKGIKLSLFRLFQKRNSDNYKVTPSVSTDDSLYMAFTNLRESQKSPHKNKYAMTNDECSVNSYSTTRVGPKHEHPSIHSALSEFRGRKSPGSIYEVADEVKEESVTPPPSFSVNEVAEIV